MANASFGSAAGRTSASNVLPTSHPSRAFRLSLVDTPEVARIAVEGGRTPISIWISHPQWADQIVVDIG